MLISVKANVTLSNLKGAFDGGGAMSHVKGTVMSPCQI